jgi:Na+-driven multidrug efflux pump
MSYIRTPGKRLRAIRRQHRHYIPLVLFALAVGIAAFTSHVLQNTFAGEISIAAYAVVALVLRLSSLLTARLGFVCLAYIPAVSVVQGSDSDNAEALAVYAFLLLALAVLSMAAAWLWARPWMLQFKNPNKNLKKSLDN